MSGEKTYKVATLCKTFNHAPYIEECLNGFAAQETTFPCVYIVIDDASSDGEPEVIKKWVNANLEIDEKMACRHEYTSFGERYVAPLKKRPQSLFIIILLSENHHGKKDKSPYYEYWYNDAKYWAICEGDDYWITTNKLQMQVDFMDNHPDYVLCHTDFGLTNGKWRNHNISLSQDDIYFPQCLYGELPIGTLTVLLSVEYFKKLPRLYRGKGWPMGDTPLWIEMAHEGKIKYFDCVTANYRVLQNSASHGSFEKELEFMNAAIHIRRFYAQHYGVEIENNGFSQGYYLSIMKSAYKHKRIDVAKKYFKTARENGLLSLKIYVYYWATRCALFGCILGRLKG